VLPLKREIETHLRHTQEFVLGHAEAVRVLVLLEQVVWNIAGHRWKVRWECRVERALVAGDLRYWRRTAQLQG